MNNDWDILQNLSRALINNGDGTFSLRTSGGGGGGGMEIGGEVTGGTAGSVLFVDASGDLGQDNANFFWDDTANQLLLGGASAAGGATLHVRGAGTTTGKTILTENSAGTDRFYVRDDGYQYMGTFSEVSDGTIFADASVLFSGNSASRSYLFNFYDTGSHRMSLTRVGGELRIGPTAASPTAKLTVEAASSTEKVLILQGATSHTGNMLEVMNSSDTAYVTIGEPPRNATQQCVLVNPVTTGTTGERRGLYVNMQAGFTGAGIGAALHFINSMAGTGTGVVAGSSGNFGVMGESGATTAGSNAAGWFYAYGGNVNYGLISQAVIAKNSATNVGVMGLGLNTGTTPTQVGGFFGLMSAAPTFASAALMADNGATTSDIFVARDNGTATFKIADGGGVTINGIAYVFPSDNGDADEVLTTDGAGNLTWEAGGGGSPGGSDTQVQFNDGGAFGGDSGLTYNKTTDALTVGGTVTAGGASSGQSTINLGLTVNNAVAAAKVGGVIYDYYADAGTVGTGEDDLFTRTLTAGILGANGEKITAHYAGTITADPMNTAQIKVYFGGTAIYDTGAITPASSAEWDIKVEIIRVSASVIRASVIWTADSASTTLINDCEYTEVTGLTLANTQVLKITGESAGANVANNDIVAKLGHIKWYPAA